MKVGENEAYYTALRFYGGAVAEDAAMTTFHLANGNAARACALPKRIADEPNRNAFGVIAAEVDLAQGGVCR